MPPIPYLIFGYMEVTTWIKRRIEKLQAVIRKGKAIEPRKRGNVGRADGIMNSEGNTTVSIR
jgi:hypothetical protein